MRVVLHGALLALLLVAPATGQDTGGMPAEPPPAEAPPAADAPPAEVGQERAGTHDAPAAPHHPTRAPPHHPTRAATCAQLDGEASTIASATIGIAPNTTPSASTVDCAGKVSYRLA